MYQPINKESSSESSLQTNESYSRTVSLIKLDVQKIQNLFNHNKGNIDVGEMTSKIESWSLANHVPKFELNDGDIQQGKCQLFDGEDFKWMQIEKKLPKPLTVNRINSLDTMASFLDDKIRFTQATHDDLSPRNFNDLTLDDLLQKEFFPKKMSKTPQLPIDYVP